MSYCPTGKVRHERKQDAVNNYKKMRAKGLTSGKIQFYKCGLCGFWHFGHKGNHNREEHRENALVNHSAPEQSALHSS